jgi:DtxR family Mn-dependent transcriptional regulator
VKTELSLTEENYLKAIYHLSEGGTVEVSTNALSDEMQTKPATVSDMIRKLAKKKVISYEKYKGVNIAEPGKQLALHIIRKHRLWEVFLVEKLDFNWDEVHEIAEQLEHIKSPTLVERLDDFLGNPTVDPHGDPIPDKNGNFKVGPTIRLSELLNDERGVFVSVSDDDPRLLQYLDKVEFKLGDKFTILDKIDFDDSVKLRTDQSKDVFLSGHIAGLLSIRKIV